MKETELSKEDEIYRAYLNGISFSEGTFSVDSFSEPIVQQAAYAQGVIDKRNAKIRPRREIVAAVFALLEPGK